MGRSLTQLFTRIAVTVALVAFIYLLWLELARLNSAFRMGAGGETTIILFLTAFGFLFLADPLASTVGNIIGYPTLSLLSGPPSFSLLDPSAYYSVVIQVGGFFLFLAVLFFVILILRSRR
jgi:hypothetical protein